MENLLAGGKASGDLYVYNVQSESPLVSAVNFFHKGSINRINWHPSYSNVLMTASNDGTLQLLDTRTAEIQKTVCPNSRSVRDFEFSPFDHFSLAACFDDGTLQTFDLRKLEERRGNLFTTKIFVHRSAVCLNYHPTKRDVLSVGGINHGFFENLKILSLDAPTSGVMKSIKTLGGIYKALWRPG